MSSILGVSCCGDEIARRVPIVAVICVDAKNLEEKRMEKKLKMLLAAGVLVQY